MKRNVILWLIAILVMAPVVAMAQTRDELRLVDISKYATVLDPAESQALARRLQESILGTEPPVPIASCFGVIVDRTGIWGDKELVFQSTSTIPKGTDIILLVSSAGRAFATLIRFDFDFGEGFGFELMRSQIPFWVPSYSVTFEVSVPALGPTARARREIYNWGDMTWRSTQITSITEDPLPPKLFGSPRITISGRFPGLDPKQYEVVVDYSRVKDGSIISVSSTSLIIDPRVDEKLVNIYPGRHYVTVRGPDGSCDTFIGWLEPVR